MMTYINVHKMSKIYNKFLINNNNNQIYNSLIYNKINL